MKYQLFRLKRDKFDHILESVIKSFENTKEIYVDEKLLSDSMEAITSNSSAVYIDFDIDYYNSVAFDDTIPGYTKFAKIGMQLHKDLNVENVIPKNVLYEKELWAYLSLTMFSDIVQRLRLNDSEKVNGDKIRRFYFNAGSLSRTGLLFLWSMIDRLGAEENYEIAHTAFEFIDTVKAIFERTFSKNPAILQAYVQGIINNEKDARFKSNTYRTRVPNHISCYAGVNMLDAYSYEELVEVMTEQQKTIISQTLNS